MDQQTKELVHCRYESPKIQEVYLDGVLKDEGLLCGNEGSFGMFMHSLILSSTGNELLSKGNKDFLNNLYETAAEEYLKKSGFSINTIVAVTPEITNIKLDNMPDIKTGAFLINEQMRIVGRGLARDVLKYCTHIIENSGFVRMTRKMAIKTCMAVEYMMSKGLSVYAIAIKDMDFNIIKEKPVIDGGFALLALVGV